MALAAEYDAVVIGSGPNGLAAAITFLQAGKSVIVYEAMDTPGGGVRSAELTRPGFVHDVCSAVYPLAAGSPFFRSLPLEKHGLEWVHSDVPLAHPLEDGEAVLLHRSVETTAAELGADRDAYRDLMSPLVSYWRGLDEELLAPFHVPRHPLWLASFGLQAMRPARRLADRRFRAERARALFGGLAAHSMLPLEARGSAAFGLILAMAAHGVGWPIARGGAQNLTRALVSYLRSLGGEIATGRRIDRLDSLPRSRAVLCDLTPRQLLALAGPQLPDGYRRRLQAYRYGPGAFKMDWALKAPVPWRARECSRAATVHVGGSLQEIAASERAAWGEKNRAGPFVLLAQPSLFDSSRAPQGHHTLWAYCHVPNGSKVDMSEAIERQIERFAPGFRDVIQARNILDPAALEARNPNLVGGDINGGAASLDQLFLRPTWRLYKTPVAGLYICSSSTPPGGGVHGMCGYFAALRALKDRFS